ncbi:DNA-directed RNA polymerase specialized sigma24 family protein [Curtobacterium sp. SORGH_AS776]|nr:DNA-directed RNA polymerase specialized sigma24 family protein [Curtobacterium sp. SORGH_AS_0776]
MTAAAPATVPRVGNPKRVLSAEDEQAIRDVLNRAQAVQDEVRTAVLTAHAHGASVRSLAEFTGMSTNTIMRWKKDAT